VLRKQLAAEQKQWEQSVRNLENAAIVISDLREQLAAEQKQYEELAVASVDKIKTLVDALKRIADGTQDYTTSEIATSALTKVKEAK
jgi:cell division protein FtsX